MLLELNKNLNMSFPFYPPLQIREGHLGLCGTGTHTNKHNTYTHIHTLMHTHTQTPYRGHRGRMNGCKCVCMGLFFVFFLSVGQEANITIE